MYIVEMLFACDQVDEDGETEEEDEACEDDIIKPSLFSSHEELQEAAL
jgi:hypothetical protein